MGTWERAWGAGTHRLQRRVGGRFGREARQAVGGEAGQGPCGEACIALQSGAEPSRAEFSSSRPQECSPRTPG